MSEIIEGYGASVEVSDDGIIIRRKGLLSFSLHGMKGAKSIPFASIAAVQFKAAGLMTSGYIQFSILGGNESRGGLMAATKDENSILFKNKRQNADFERLRSMVEAGIKRARLPISVASPTSNADELAKLADLLDRGLLTRAEFDQQKASLLG